MEAEALMKEGKMVPMSLVMGLLKNEIQRQFHSTGFLIDGFPRTMEQALEFEKEIGPCRSVLYFNCPMETLEARLLERGKTSGRADDNIDTIKKRFHTFQNESLPVIQYFKKKGKVTEISSDATVSSVYEQARVLFEPHEILKLKNIVFVLGGILAFFDH
jgi:adenylate kinase